MKILGIETSCDETSVSIVEDGKKVLSNVVFSQIDFHKEFFGVVPEIASRKHLEYINISLELALKDANLDIDNIDAVACTFGPGLASSLLIGVNVAKTLSFFYDIPLIKVDHVLAHVFSANIENDVEFPFIGVVVSGGHTLLFVVKDFEDIQLVGHTVDDAVGEAFDKVAKLLGLGYPGGPVIDEMSKKGNPNAFRFPLGLIDDPVDKYNFSYSGLKTKVLYTLRELEKTQVSIPVEDICASFQKSAIDIIYKKAKLLSKETGINTLVVAGGVAANSYLRKVFLEDPEIKVFIPSIKYCTDNAAMVASLGFYIYKRNIFASLDEDIYTKFHGIVKGKRKK